MASSCYPLAQTVARFLGIGTHVLGCVESVARFVKSILLARRVIKQRLECRLVSICRIRCIQFTLRLIALGHHIGFLGKQVERRIVKVDGLLPLPAGFRAVTF